MEGLWSEALPVLRAQVGERNFSTWIEPIRTTGGGGELRLEVPSRFFQEWLSRHFLSTIEQTLARLSGAPCSVRVVIGGAQVAAERTASRDPVPEPEEEAQSPRGPRIGTLVPHYTFATFVVGEANRVAFRAAQLVSAQPGKRFNPVFLHGGVGLGKTHLINAIAHEMLARRDARFRLACLSAESFMNQLIGSLRQDQMNAFRERFRQVDALILDDVQFLAGKERTQEEFFHTFNALYGAQKQIVLTSDKPPAAINGLEQRLRSRFEGGLIADIHPPTPEMRLEIVRAKAARQGLTLLPEVIRVIADRSGPTVRELEGAFNRVVAAATVRDTPITREVAESVLQVIAVPRRRVTIDAVQEAVSSRFGLSVAALTSHRRGREISFARQVAMYLSRTVANASFAGIGDKFGGRDHSTVMYAVRAVEERRGADPTVDQLVAGIETDLLLDGRA